MTLVYAEKNETNKAQVRVWADTSTYDQSATLQQTIPGVLKSVVVSPDMCISFAGSVTGCLDVVRKIIRNNGSEDLDSALKGLLSHNIENPQDSDFLVCFKNEIHRISAGEHFTGMDSCWIGDPSAASEFLTTRSTLLEPNMNIDAFSENNHAFNQIIKNPRIDSVGGIGVLVVRGVDGYLYERGIHVTSPKEIPAGATVKVESGGAALGGYSYTFMVPVSAGIPVTGIYFPPGNVGYLYHPLESDAPTELVVSSQKEFIDIVKSKHGVLLHGMPIN